MSMRNVWLALAWLGVYAGAAPAQGYFPGQPYNPAAQPAFSPYLNLLRSGGSPTLNYFGLVRPQQNFQEAVQQLDQQNLSLSNQQNATAANAAATVLPQTGRGARFMTQGKYFQTNGGGVGGGGQFGAAFGGQGFGGQQGLQGLQSGQQGMQGMQGMQGLTTPQAPR